MTKPFTLKRLLKRHKENPTVNVDDFTKLIKKGTQEKPFDKK